MKRRNSKVYRWWLFLAALTLVVMGLPLWLSPAAASNTVTILEEHFDAPQVPAGWSVNNLLAGIGWRFDDPGSRGNNTGGNGGFAIADSDHAGTIQMDTSLETPAMDLSSYAQVSLEFKTYYYPYMNDYVAVDVSYDNGITWTELWKQTSTAFEGTVNLDLTAQAAGKANIKVRFHYGNAYYAYYWKIDDVKVSGETTPVPTPIPPTPTPSAPVAPSALAQSGGGTQTQLSLSWTDNSNDEQGFYIERSPNGSTNWSQIGSAGVDVTTYTDSGLTCGTPYHYRVRAYNRVGYSGYSNVAVVTTNACITPPTTPSGLAKASGTANEITLEWADNSSDEDGFKIERSPNGTSDWAQVGTTGVGITTYTDNNLTCGSTYHYRVLAYNTSGNSGYSNVLATATAACPPLGTGLEEHFDTTATPTGWTVHHNTGSTGWSFNDPYQRGNEAGGTGNFAIADGGTGYGMDLLDTELRTPALDLSSYGGVLLKFKTYYLPSGFSTADVEISTDGGTTWTNLWQKTEGYIFGEEIKLDISAQAAGQANVIVRFHYANTKYYMSYWQLDDVFVTGYSATPPPDAPSALQKVSASESQISLSWTDNSTNEDGFKLERSVHGQNGWQPLGTTGANATGYTDKDLPCATAYDYRVYAYNISGSSISTTLSNVATSACVNLPTAPSNLTAAVVNENKITLTWQDNSDNEEGFYLETFYNGIWTTVFRSSGTTTHTFWNLPCNTEYAYRIQAVNLDGKSAYTPIITTTTKTCAPPTAPQDLSSSHIGATGLKLSWLDKSDNETGFKVERSTDGGTTWTQLSPVVNANMTEFAEHGLACNTVYQYRVRAIRTGIGDSNPSNVERVRTAACTVLNETFDGTGAVDTMALHLPLNEAPGATTFTDVSGNGYNGACSGAACPATGQAGLYGVAANFDGSDVIEVPYASALNPGSFTVAGWAKVTGGNGYRSVWTSRDGGPARGYVLYVTPDNKWEFWVGSGDRGWTTIGNVPVTNNVWTHLASVYDAISQTMYFYVNGQLVGSKSGVAFAPNTQRPLRIGAGATEGAVQFYFTGMIDDVRVYDHALSMEEVHTIMSPGYWTMTQHLTFDENAGATTFIDVSGNGYNGTCSGAACPVAGQNGWHGTALSFDGANDYIEVPYTSALNPDSFTVAGWAKVTGGSGYRSVWTSRDGGPARGYVLYVTPDNKWEFWVGSGDSGWTTIGNVPVTNNVWTHLASVYDATSQTMYFYVNGQLVGSKSGVAFAPNTQRPLRIGAGATEGAVQFYFTGMIDDVYIYGHALSADEVRALTSPGGWTVANNNTTAGKPGWLPGIAENNTGGSGNAVIADRVAAGGLTQWQMNTILRTPALDLSNYTLAQLEFKTMYRADYYTDGNPGAAQVQVSTDGGITWTALRKFFANEDTQNGNPFVINLTPYAGLPNVQVQFAYQAKNSGFWQVDDVTITGATGDGTAPAAPSNLVHAGGSETDIVLNWTDNSTDESGFVVERSGDGAVWQVLGVTGEGITTYTDRDLGCSQTYQYRVRARNAAGFSAYTPALVAATATCSAPPSAPGNLTKKEATPTEITLTWFDRSGNESGFKIERSKDGQEWQEIGSVVAQVTTYTDKGLFCNTAYRYRVRAFNSVGYSGYTDEAWTRTDACASALKPAAPTNLTPGGQTETGMTITWTDNSTNEAGFRIERSANNRDWTLVGSTAANVTQFSDSGLECATTYVYRVYAYSAGGGNSDALTGNGQTAACPITIPNAPSNLSATAGETTVTLNWSDNSDNEGTFKIERSPNGQTAWSQITALGANATSYTDTGLKCNTTYYYRVRAYREGHGDSDYTNVFTIKTTTCPDYPDKCEVAPTGSIVLMDVAANPSEDTYRVLLEIQEPVITNKSANGCNVSGKMHLILHSNNVSDIPITGKVDQYDTFRSDSIGHFSLVIAGVRLYTQKPWDIGLPIPPLLGTGPDFNGKTLYMNSAWIGMPPEFGGGSLPLLKAPSISESGLDFGARIGLPKFNINSDTKDDKGKDEFFKLKLAVELKFTSRGFELSGEGGLEIPGTVAGGQGCTELSAEGSLYINEATGETMLEFQTVEDIEPVPLMSLTDEGQEITLNDNGLVPGYEMMPFMANNACGQPDWRGIGGKVSLGVECSPGIPLDGGYNIIVLSGVRGSVALGMEDTSISMGVTIYVVNNNLLKVEGDATFSVLPEFKAEVEAKLKMLFFQMGYAKVAISESDGFRAEGELRDPSFPILKYEASLHAWISGIERNGVNVTIANPESHLTASGRAYIGIAKGEIVDKEIPSPCIVKWEPFTVSAPNWLAAILKLFGLPTSFTVQIPTGVNTKYVKGYYPLRYCSKPRQVCSNGNTYNGFNCWLWDTRYACDQHSTFNIPYPSRDAIENCPVHQVIPDKDLKSFEVLSEFGEFKGPSSNSIWGLKGYAKILFINYGYFVDFGADPRRIDWVNYKSYALIDSRRVLAARQAWETARQGHRPLTADEATLVDAYTFQDDGSVLINTPNFDPPGYQPRAAFSTRDAITQTNVISKTDTLFGVTTHVPVVMSLISPDGVEITPDNYTTVPTYTVAYSEVYTYTLERTANEELARWRFVPAATHPDLLSVDLSLDGSTIYTNVSVQTGYIPIPAGPHVMEIAPHGVTQPALLADFTAEAGIDYTILSLGHTVSETQILTDDNSSPPALGQAKVRLVNTIYHDAQALDVYIDGEMVWDNVPYAGVSDYITLTAAAHTVEMKRGGTEDLLLTNVITPTEGAVYTYMTREWPSNPVETVAMFVTQDSSPQLPSLLSSLADLAPDTSYVLIWEPMLDESYIPITTTKYAVDQATIGTWQVKLTGAITETGWALSVTGVENPPIISNFVVDYDNDWPESTDVELRLQADYAPVRLTFFVKPGVITETLTITREDGTVSTFDTPLYQGIAMDVITITEPALLDGSQLITHTLDFFELESGGYSLWVQVEDGVSPAVNAYAALKPRTRAELAALGSRTVNIAAESYDPFRALENTGVFSVDQTVWFTDDLVAGTVITPELNVELWEWDEALDEWVFSEHVPLNINWDPLWHPDADYQVVAIDQWLEDDEVFTETDFIRTDFTVYEVYEEIDGVDEYVGSVSMANWYDIVPGETYYLAVGLLDTDRDMIVWSDYEELEVPLGSFGLTWEEEYLEPYFWPGDDYGEIDTSVLLTMTEDLYYELDIDFDYSDLPEGIEVEFWEDEEELARKLTARGKRAPDEGVPCSNCQQRVAMAPEDEVYEEYVDIVIYVDDTVPDGWYTLPVVATAGQETSIAEIEFYVEQSSYSIQLSAGYTETVAASQTVVYRHTLTNTGDAVDTYYVWGENYDDWDVHLESDEGIWSDEFEDLEFTAVEPGDSFSFEVYVSVPAATPLGTIGETDVIVISEFDDEAFDWVTDFTIVNKAAEASFALSPGYTQQTIADTVLTYTHTITNTGALTDTYSLVVGNDQGWQVALAGGDWPQGTLLLPLTLAPQDKQTFTLHVTVPAGAEGVTAHTTLTATSQLAPGALQTVADTTIVTQSGYNIYLPLLLRIHGG